MKRLSDHWWYVERPFPVGLILLYVLPVLVIVGLFAVAILCAGPK